MLIFPRLWVGRDLRRRSYINRPHENEPKPGIQITVYLSSAGMRKTRRGSAGEPRRSVGLPRDGFPDSHADFSKQAAGLNSQRFGSSRLIVLIPPQSIQNPYFLADLVRHSLW